MEHSLQTRADSIETPAAPDGTTVQDQVETPAQQAARATPLRWPVSLPAVPALLGRTSLILVLGFAFAAAMIYVFGELAEEILERETIGIDLATILFLDSFSSPALTTAAWVVSLFGAQLLFGFAGALSVFFLVRQAWTSLLSVIITTGGAQLLNSLLKASFERPRPSYVETYFAEQVWSFPSGHAMVSAAFYGLLAYLAWSLFKGHYRYAAVAAMVVTIMLICVSRLILGVHYLTDVVAGTAVGLLWMETVVVSLAALRWGFHRRRQKTS